MIAYDRLQRSENQPADRQKQKDRRGQRPPGEQRLVHEATHRRFTFAAFGLRSLDRKITRNCGTEPSQSRRNRQIVAARVYA